MTRTKRQRYFPTTFNLDPQSHQLMKHWAREKNINASALLRYWIREEMEKIKQKDEEDIQKLLREVA